MLKGLDPLLGPELLMILRAQVHLCLRELEKQPED